MQAGDQIGTEFLDAGFLYAQCVDCGQMGVE